NCAPKETALAEANIKFAQDALDMGEYYRGKQHAEDAAYWTQLARDRTDAGRCREQPMARVGDRDGDGYDDEVDACPDEPEDFDSFEDDDGCPDRDNDADGVLDAAELVSGKWTTLDRKDDRDCRNEPEDFDGFEDGDGCPDPDNDNDGIPDDQDECIDEPEDGKGKGKDDKRRTDGCPEESATVN